MRVEVNSISNADPKEDVLTYQLMRFVLLHLIDAPV